MFYFVGRKKLGQRSILDGRLRTLTLIFFIITIIIIWRLFILQIIRHDYYVELADKRNDLYQSLQPNRGQIYTKEKDTYSPIVINKNYFLIYANPMEIKDKAKIVDSLTPILGLHENEWKEILSRLNKSQDPYEPIQHKVTREQVDEIKKFELSGIYFSGETYRFYPETNFGGHILGFYGFQEDKKVGLYGIEGFFNEKLSGKPGMLESIKDAWGFPVTVGKRSIVNPVDGVNIVLTLDKVVQLKSCEMIKEAISTYNATGGTILISDPQSGAIIALCNFPDFDPDNYNVTENINYYNNPAIFFAYEPGSVFKSITMAAGLELQKITPQSTYDDTGEVKLIGHNPIKNSDLKAHGIQNMIQVLEKSLNTGAVYVVSLVGREKFQEYVKNFGFGHKTGITLDYESPGNIRSLNKKGDIYMMTASFGQGITITSLQLVSAYGAIANGGKLYKPYIHAEIIYPDGRKEKTQPQVIQQVIKPSTASVLNGMLISVVERGYSKKAGVEGYAIAGKSGTAQVADSSGRYGSETIHTFIGYGPAYNPKFVLLVKLDSPKKYAFSSETSAPVFGKMAQFLLNYYQIPPEK